MATLNVRDALSYLDQVKVQFQSSPDVYNRFLDIMKDFKSQSIDTPGVIERVSTLFRGHPALIQGFNTFLPPGYRIECITTEDDVDGSTGVITVTTPTGTTTTTQSAGIASILQKSSAAAAAEAAAAAAAASGAGSSSRNAGSGSRHEQSRSGSGKNAAAAAAAGAGFDRPDEASGEGRSSGRALGTALPKSPSLSNNGPVAASTPTHAHSHGANAQLDGSSSTSPTAAGILSGAPASVIGASGALLPATPGAAAGAGVLSHSAASGNINPFNTPTNPGVGSAAMVQTPSAASDVGTPGGKRPPVEFNHAINYVNKIKMRFAGDPDTYKTFLEILQTYQKEQRPIHDVYAQVTQLFSHATDLLEEFKQFLPDTSGNAHQPPSETGASADGHGGGSALGAAGLAQGHDHSSLAALSASGAHRGSADDTAVHGTSSGKKTSGNSSSRGKKRSAADASAGTSSSSRSAAAPISAAAAAAVSASGTSGSKSKKSKHSHKTGGSAAASSSDVKGSQSAAQQQQSAALAQQQQAQHSQQQQQQQQAAAQHQAAQAQAQAVAQQAHLLAQSGPAAALDPQQLAQVHQLHAAGLQAFAADGTLITPEMANAAATAHAHSNLGGYALQVANAANSVLATTDEVHFFDRVKKYIDDRPTYTEFLKLLNLFTQDLIDVRTLVDRAHVFFGRNTELFGTFKRLAGYDIGRHGWLDSEEPVVENVPAISRDRVDLSTCKTYGASYRKLPESEVSLACSGRDAMCWEVLNDTWVCHPTWASEGESFNPHKKNQYEDALYRSEEERHEYDYHIEANLRTIALLEPIAARIQSMPAEERAIFRLRPGLGGQSRSIYQRVIKKVYGRDHGLEVIAALHDNPVVAVPVVLARLKQKDEEWKRAQREWNKVWREVDSRNFYKSLDHQGITFKAADKKNVTHKAFIAEIEARRTSQQQRRLNLDPDLPRARTEHQLAYTMTDKSVIFDVLKLSFIYLDRTPYSKPDSDRIEAFLRTFIPKFMCLDQAEFEEALKVHADGAFIGGDDGDSDSAGDLDEEEGSRFGGGDEDGEATKNNGAAREDIDMADASTREEGAKGVDGSDEPAAPQAEANWIQTDLTTAYDSTQGLKNGTRVLPAGHKKINFFCNSAYYVFLRLFQLLYSRLYKLKSISEALSAQSDVSRRLNPVALELGLQDGTTYPSAAISSTKSASAIINPSVGITAETAGLFLPPSRYYETLLDLTEKLLENDIDQGVFEESVRFMYGIDGYISFTLDKVVGALVKSVQSITTDLKSQELMNILDRDRARQSEDNTAFRRQIASRMAAEAVVGKEENLYRIEWQADDGNMLMQLLSKDDLTLDDLRTNQEQWLYYISSYCLWTDTEGLNGKAQAPFLSRSLPPERENAVDAPGTTYTIKSGLEIKVCIRTYRLFFVDETEDVFVRHAVMSDPSKYEERVHKLKTRRAGKFDAWLDRRRQEIDHPETVEAVVPPSQQAEEVGATAEEQEKADERRAADVEAIRATLEQAEGQVVAMDTDAADEAAAGHSKDVEKGPAATPAKDSDAAPSEADKAATTASGAEDGAGSDGKKAVQPEAPGTSMESDVAKTEKDALAGEPQPQPSGEAVKTEDGGEAPKQGLEAEGGAKAAATATATATAPASDKP